MQDMTDNNLHELFWGLSIISLAKYFLRGLLRKSTLFISYLGLCNSSVSSSSSSHCSSPPAVTVSWIVQYIFQGLRRKLSPALDGDHSPSEEESFSSGDQYRRPERLPAGGVEWSGNSSMNGGIDFLSSETVGKEVDWREKIRNNGGVRLRKRPPGLLVPESCGGLLMEELIKEMEKKKTMEKKREFHDEVEGKDFCLVSKQGRREAMEDSYRVILDVLGDPNQAFFTVIDGHGGRAAAEYVAENLGKNIFKAVENVERENLEEAIREGYLTTDREFLSQGVSSGACAVCVLVMDGNLHIANVGDCGVVLSRNGVAESLSMDHRLQDREDECTRIENSGGFIHCHNGVSRVQGTLAISRAIGDLHLKEWIISEPEMRKLSLTSDCDFLIIASDGLWDKVKEQEAVDVVGRQRSSMMESCKKLLNMSCSRGNKDDITVMVISLQKFI